LQTVEETPTGQIILKYRNGDFVFRYSDGTEVLTSQGMRFTRFRNGDRQQDFVDGARAYKYSESGTITFEHPNGAKVIQFMSGRREAITADGKRKVTYHVMPLTLKKPTQRR
jgi:hypothetical protein